MCWRETIGTDHSDCRRKQNRDENQKIWVILLLLAGIRLKESFRNISIVTEASVKAQRQYYFSLNTYVQIFQ